MYEFLDQAVNWAEELQIYLILDNHNRRQQLVKCESWNGAEKV